MNRLAAPAAVAFLGLAVASIVTSVPRTAIAWHAERIRFEHFTATERRYAPVKATLPGVSPKMFDVFDRALRPGDTFAVQIGFGGAAFKQGVAMYMRFALLPHLQVAPRHADVVFSVDADPHALRLRYSSLTKLSATIAPHSYVSRVARGR